MRPIQLSRLAVLLSLTGVLAGCSSVDFSQPEMQLPARYSEGADIRLIAFSGSAGLDSVAEGPSLSILRDQISYGTLRCSRPGPGLDLTVDADFATRKDADHPDHLIGVATWRDPVTGQVVGRHHLDVEVHMNVHDRSYVSVNSDPEETGSSVPRGQLGAGEALVAQVCEKAFGWSSPRG
jgi:hypothetical protein